MKKSRLYYFDASSPEGRFRIHVLSLLLLAYAWLFYHLIIQQTSMIGNQLHLQCPSMQWLGFPCPGCGTTRSALSILRGHFFEAFWWNPFGYLAIIFLAFVPLIWMHDAVTNRNNLWLLYRKTEQIISKKWIIIPLMMIILINWIWNWVKYTG